MRYHIYYEDGCKIRIVDNLWEAKHIVGLRPGWKYVRIKPPAIIFEEALF